MKKRKYKILTIILVAFCCLILSFSIKNNHDSQLIQETVKQTIKTYEMSQEQIEQLPSTEIVEQSLADEQEVSAEQEVEDEGFELQGKIAYEGDRANTWNVELGDYIGLTYYNQTDSRWKNHQYSSIGNSSQTIGTSGCGPTSAAMIVTATRGAITPPQMGDLFVQYGYRSASDGTYWAAFRAVADEFDIEYQETSSLDTALNLIRNNNYVIVSVGNGLFTTGGHFIVIVGIDGNTLKIYDPYLYAGKFDTSTRRGKVTVSGNTVYCSIDNFRNYANYKGFFAYQHSGNVQENTGNVTVSGYTRYVKTNTGIGVNVRNSANGGKIGALADGTTVTVAETNGSWSRITSPIYGWVSSDYLSTSYSSSVSNISNTVGQTRKTKACYLYSNSNLTGTKYTYKANTTVTILQNISAGIDKVKVNMTGRIAYISTSNYTNSTTSTIKNTVGQYKRLANKTYLYSKSNLTGTKYTYLPLTQAKIIKNISSNVDYVYVVKTGRYAYININAYK